jgi:hypothetical protein
VSLNFYFHININMVVKLAEKLKRLCHDQVHKVLHMQFFIAWYTGP